ncbi:Uu.00g008420.m01.CDS01 [Anthostomella pinea]|uniref:Uu.00g008420.m01.CDS01 n=1 Tax=Anthostomella pinea TaxID=933095 RepID=A0AAI8YPV0_9PEZI|nr:Uu.00g008420.m01.CDS01 [Anthostomella pinea]
MTGPTLTATVSPARESTQSFHSSSSAPSHSTPDLDLRSNTISRRPSLSAHNRSLSATSLPSLPTFDLPSFDFDSDLDTTLTFSRKPLENTANEKPQTVRTDETLGVPRPRTSKMGKRRTMLSRPQSWMPSSKSTPDVGEMTMEDGYREAGVTKEDDGSKFLNPNSQQERSRNVSKSFASLAKRSWISASRSPSPGKRKEESERAPESDVRPSRERSASNSSIMKLRKTNRKRSGSPTEGEGGRTADTSGKGKIGNYLTKIKSRPQNVLAKGKLQSEFNSPASSTTSLAPPSTDTRKSHASETSTSTYPEDVLPVPRSPQVRDPLWSVFKGVETDFHRFQVKSTSLKMNLVRTALVPFLRKHACHSSNKHLHHEDLERRATILNKWWCGLIEMLEGKTETPVPGVDRPVLLDATSTLMMRPEWRQSIISFTPLADRSPRERVWRSSQFAPNESSSSVETTDSAYLAESARHNVRTMFISNLVSQMAIVVDKMAMRHAPYSIVNFAGKACAYAFFFAPGIADVLVRLWSLTPNLLRRAADEFDLPRRSKRESDDIVALFPPCIHALGWTSVKAMSDSLRQVAKAPLAATKIAWHGPWISRWNGRDSDVFFIFCKYYFILAQEFLPSDLPLVEKARAPAFVLINAQILAILDSTIHRQAAVEAMSGPPLADAIYGADASIMASQVTPNNSNIMKGMNENRLIVLLKDFLSGASITFTDARNTFAESFMALMQAAAKRTSQYDHNACFTICDFLEESLVAYDNFVDVQRPDLTYANWPFWFDVCQKILESNNSMSEIRVLSLVFSIWDTISSDQGRKESVCLDWLLTEETFDRFFNNWCPMVRAYYMRLLCWRICRDAGSANGTDAKIFVLVSARLKTVWSHYLWLKQTAEKNVTIPPSTAPSFPTPGKRFMIIRSEVPTVHQGLMVGFDSSSSQQDMASNPATDFDSISMDLADPECSSNQKKKWGVLGKMFSFNGSTSGDNDLDAVRRDTAASRTRPPLPPKSSNSVVSPPGSDSDSMGSSPTYEATQYVFRFTLSWNAAGTMSPPNRILTRPRLPNPAQSWVTAKGRSGSPPPPAAGRPAPTRAVSGSPMPGLVASAKNAGVSEAPASQLNLSTALDRQNSIELASPIDQDDDDLPMRSLTAPTQEPIITPVQPKAFFASTVKYAGRALAEWSLVVAECNSFVDRRRDEGVLGLSEVEVPALGVEGFRKLDR